MKKIYIFGLLCALTATVNGGLITHNDYTSGATITASGQNTNENAVFNEFNGNIESANIKDGTIVNADISGSAAIGFTKLDAPTQSSSTFMFNTLGYLSTYKRPGLVWINATTVDISSNTGTANQTCVIFPDGERRCVTENTATTNVNRRCILTATASTSGTKDSGLRINYNLTGNTWYSFYAVKATDTSDFVVVADTINPTFSNYTALNTAYASNGWVYLGMGRYGNNDDITTGLLRFSQRSDMTILLSSAAASNRGVVLSSGSPVSVANYLYAAGFSGTQIPSNITFGLIQQQGTSGTVAVYGDSGTTLRLAGAGAGAYINNFWADVTTGFFQTNTSSALLALHIYGWKDDALGSAVASPY